jgi:septum formation protein
MLLLASASPRRRELLRNAGIEFEVLSVPVDETPLPGEEAEALARRLAQAKARAAHKAAQNDQRFVNQKLLVLGADTVVTVDGHVLGKPADEEDAARMLRLLSGKTHQVITGIALEGARGPLVDSVTTEVTFSPITEAEVRAYIATGEPMDKAGAYAIQGIASRWAVEINGCYFNVVGLPVSLVWRLTAAHNQ